MHLLYVDESGHAADPQQEYFVLAGISVFERRSWWISNALDQIAAQFDAAHPESIELHGSPMLQGRDEWKHHPRNLREQAMLDALAVVQSHWSNRVFAVVVKKSAVSPQDPVLYAFEQLTSRFDQYLGRMYKRGEKQRGIILFDKSVHERSLQNLARDFREIGHSWGVLRNLSEVPVFIDSRASRLVQLADLVAFAVFRRWEKDDERFYNVIRGSFDQEGGISHGIHVRE